MRISLRIAERDYPVRAQLVEDAELRKKVVASFRDKYGTGDALIALIRGNDPRIIHIMAR